MRASSLSRSSGIIAWATRSAPNGVGLHRPVGVLEVEVGDRVVGAVDAGVVDEDVEAPGVVADRLRCGIDARLVGDVELDRGDPLPRLDVGGVARAGEHAEAVIGGELPRDLGADAAARARDQRHPLVVGGQP